MEPLVRKRSGKVVPFSRVRIVNAVFKAMRAVGQGSKEDAEKIADAVSVQLYRNYFKKGDIPHVETIQDLIERTLMERGYPEVAKAYILYREKRRQAREISQALVDGINLIEEYLGQEDWRVRENSNMNYSLQGLNFHVSSSIVARYWLEKLYPEEVARAHKEGDFHIHDLGVLGPYTYYGKEIVIAKYKGELLLLSFEKLYELLEEEEYILEKRRKAFAKRPEDLYVLDKDGWVKVTRVTKKRKDKKMRFIENRGGRSVIVTEDHPMITRAGEKQASDVLEDKDELFTADLKRLLSGESLFQIKKIDLLEEVLKDKSYFFGRTEVYFNGLPIEEFSFGEEEGILHTRTFSSPRYIHLTEDFGYFVGFVLAEGYLSYDEDSPKTISIVQKELGKLLELNEGLRKTGYLGFIQRKGDFYELSIVNPFLRFLFQRVFGIEPGARNKSLPLKSLQYDLSFLKGLVGGLLDGDGNIENCRAVLNLRLSSRELLEGLAVILTLLGFTPQDRAVEGQGSIRIYQGREIRQNYPLYGLSFRKIAEIELPSEKYAQAEDSKKAWHDEDRDAWHKVTNNLEVEIPDEWIYDITTESGTLLVNGMWNHNCVGWDLYDLLLRGFGGVSGKVESAPPKHFRSALGQIVNFFYTLQGESAGAQAFSNFDTLLAPFVRYDKLSYQEVKQCMQEFLFNLNVPTRVGFQCLSEDTEILTPEGWKTYKDIDEGVEIYTFNLNTGAIEVKRVTQVFKRHYEGPMYNLKNRNQDQLISPRHRVVRQVFNTETYTLQPIEELLSFKSPIPIPVCGENVNPDYPISDEELKLIAWVLAEGSIEKDGSNRISIYQSKEKNKDNYEEIIGLLNCLGLSYTEREQESWGICIHIRLNPSSSKYVHAVLGNPSKKFPTFLYKLSKRQARLFLETYAKGDGWIEGGRVRIVTTDRAIADGLAGVAVLAGYNVGIKTREPSGGNKKLRYELTLTETKTDYIQEIKEVSYSGVIWSVHTENETVIARRAGQIFITGNTPFTNLTFDLKPSKLYANTNVLIGGKPRDEVYGEFHEEMSMINRAFCELMMAGDAKGRIFTFPIPTYNITKDFDWDNPDYEPLWEMTRKYGIPYFANFVNSDMDPDDARSMCLHADEELLIKNSDNIRKVSIKELVETYKEGDFDAEGWAECRKDRGLKVLSLNPKTYKLEWVGVKRFLRVVDRKAVEIKTQDGKRALYTLKHPVPVYTEDGIVMKWAKDIQPGDLLLSVKRAQEEVFQKEYQRIGYLILDEDLAKILGFFTADGNYIYETRKNMKHYGEPKGLQFNFNKNDTDLINHIKELIKTKLGIIPQEKADPRYNTYYLYVHKADLARKLYSIGFRKYGKIPQVLFNSPKSVIESFLDYFMLGDGYQRRKEIHLNDPQLARDLVLLFSLIGKPVIYQERKNSQRIYLQHAKKETKAINNWLTTPILSERVPGWLSLSTARVPGLHKGRLVGLSTLSKYDAHTEESKKLLEGDIYLVKVSEVNYQEFSQDIEFYDLELERNHLFVHSLGQISFNCCRLRLDQRELRKRGGGLFGANPLTGSIGVVTINLPRIAFLSTCEEEFFERLERLMELAKISLEIKRKVIEDFTEKGLYPYSKVYLSSIKEARGQYWANHFSTIGIVGMNEACINFLGEPIYTKSGKEFALKVLQFMREKISEFQETTGNLYNLEATPAEGTSYRLAKIDKKKFPRIKTQGTPEVPYYTNSVHLPVYYTDDIFEILQHQDDLQVMFTGGTVVHLFVGEEITDRKVVKELVRAIVHRFRLPYFSITPTFSVCPIHGYLPGKHEICPLPHSEEELARFGTELEISVNLLNRLPKEAYVKIS